jgi:hypothetical protein
LKFVRTRRSADKENFGISKLITSLYPMGFLPMIAAIEGGAHVHSEYALLASVIVAAEGATFHDIRYFAGGIVPGDGVFTTWSRKSRGIPAESTATDRAYHTRMGSGRRGSAELKSTHSGRGIGGDAARKALLDQAGLRPGQQVLDVGCGTGTMITLHKRRSYLRSPRSLQF